MDNKKSITIINMETGKYLPDPEHPSKPMRFKDANSAWAMVDLVLGMPWTVRLN